MNATFASAAALAAAATGASLGTVNYQLDPGTEFVHGCFPPCRCPIWITGSVSGGFRLQPIQLTGTFDTYSVLDVDWTVETLSGESFAVSGEGTYQIFSEVAVMQRLELDLVVGSEPVQHFDSGWVIAEVPFPQLHIAIAINGFYCLDSAFYLDAQPGPADVNGDGVVDVQDLVAVIVQWGACPQPPQACDGDVDGNLVVDVGDLIAVVLDWSG